MINFYLVGEPDTLQNGKSVIEASTYYYVLQYPCNDPHECTNFFADFPPGHYKIELYGASGGSLNDSYITTALSTDHTSCIDEQNVSIYGGNTRCMAQNSSVGGAGGYTSGYISLKQTTRVYISIGGEGVYEKGDLSNDCSNGPKGGYNGGGDACMYPSGSASGGGATDIRINENDLWHRILVAGGGGGSDNNFGNEGYMKTDDGSGGAGGGLEAQGFWIAGEYNGSYIAKQDSGFTFGNGESARIDKSNNPNGVQNSSLAMDRAGAGGGWFGGFSSHNGDGGAGGGSSFAFTSDYIIPESEIESRDSKYNIISKKKYAFPKGSPYIVSDPVFVKGIWHGNGQVKITYRPILKCSMKKCSEFSHNVLLSSVFILFASN